MNWPKWLKFGTNKRAQTLLNNSAPLPAVPDLEQRSNRAKSYRQMVREAKLDLSPEERLIAGKMGRTNLRDFSKGYYSLAQNLVSKWINAVNDRRSYQTILDELSRYWITETVIETMSEDAMCRDSKGKVLEFASEFEHIKKELDLFKREHDLDTLAKDIVPELIKNGEHTVRVEANTQEGVTAICDDLNQIGIVALYDRGTPSNFLVLMEGDYKMMPPDEYAHFVLDGYKDRIRLDDAIDPDYQIDMTKVDPELRKRLPDYVRVGKPVFLKLVSKLRELQVMEQILVAIKLNQVTQSHLVGVRVPSTSTVDEVDDILKDIEEILNDQVGLDFTSGQVTVAEIMTQSGRCKAFPLYDSEKGAVEALNPRVDSNVDDLLHSIDSMRQTILSSIGVPYSLIFGEISGQGKNGEPSRANEIRRYGRYARKLSSIQWAVAKGIKQIAMIHLNSKGIDALADSFDVVYKNQLTDTTQLERMEFEDAQQEMVLRKIDYIGNLIELAEVAESKVGDGTIRQRLDLNTAVDWVAEASNELTGGLALFRGLDEIDDDEDEEDLAISDLRDRFISVAADKFIANRQARREAEAEAEEVALVSEQLESFMDRVKLASMRRRERRREKTLKRISMVNEKLNGLNGNGNGKLFS